MKLKQIDKLQQSGAYIERIFHTLACRESSAYKEFLEDVVCPGDYEFLPKEISPELVGMYAKDNELEQLLIDNSLYGFIAEIRMPQRSDFTFREDGSFQSCRVHNGITHVKYVFCKNIKGLFKKATKIGNEYKKEQEDKARIEWAQGH